MKIHFAILPLALLLPLAACSKSEAETKSLTDQAKAGMDAAAAKVESIDFSKLAPDALATSAKSALDNLSTELGAIKDSQGATDLVAKFQPMVDQLVGLKDKLAGSLPDTTAVKQAITDFTTKFQSNEEVMKVVQPLLDKVKTLIG